MQAAILSLIYQFFFNNVDMENLPSQMYR